MENEKTYTLTEEQLATLLAAGRGPSLRPVEQEPDDAHRCQYVAIELLQLVNRSFWHGQDLGKTPKYAALCEQLKAIGKEYI